MLRLIPTAAHTLEDVEYTVNSFSEVKQKLDEGKFSTGGVPLLGEAF